MSFSFLGVGSFGCTSANDTQRRYGYYRYSGAKEAVDTARTVSNSAKQAKDKIAELSPSSTKEALGLAKSLAKSYASAIPGGAVVIDQGFTQLENFIDTHGERAAQVVKETYADIEKAAREGGDKGEAVMKALQEAANKVQNLVGEEASKGWQVLGEKYPELQKSLGSQGEELKKLADKQCVLLFFSLCTLLDSSSTCAKIDPGVRRHTLQRPGGSAHCDRLLLAERQARLDWRLQRRDLRERQEALAGEEGPARKVLPKGWSGRVGRECQGGGSGPRQDAGRQGGA